jgi:hypothetical protein
VTEFPNGIWNEKTPTAFRAIGAMSPGLVGKGCPVRELILGG